MTKMNIVDKFTALSSNEERETYLLDMYRKSKLNRETLEFLLSEELNEDMADFLNILLDEVS